MQFEIKPYSVPDMIDFNYEELKTELVQKTEMYKTVVYTDDQLKEAKADRALLNKTKTALNDERIRIQKIYMKPFDEFKAKVDDLIGTINSASAVIDKQIKEFEEKEKREKEKTIQEIFERTGFQPCVKLERMVPYKDKNKGTVAQFQLGYKGYIQLAIRSGQYKKLNVLAIKEGELIRYDPLNEEIEVSLIEDEEEREKAETIGYYAMFEYVNGFRKTLYWSKKKMQEHAKKYSPGYVSDLKNNRAWTFWSKDFDAMAYKTMLRQLISKWGIMSIDMMSAMDSDAGVISYDPDGNRTVDYVENEAEVVATQPADTAKEAVPVAEVPNAGNVSSDPEPSNEASADDISAALFGGS